MYPAAVLFCAAYILMLLFGHRRPWISLGCGALFVLTGLLPPSAIWESIDWNVLLMLAGTMGLVELFVESRMPSLLADLLLERVGTVQGAAVALALFAGLISAFVDNVSTVLIVAPVALDICRRLHTDPVPFVIAIAVSSNLQGAATLVGDTTAILLGSALEMDFMDFFFYQGRPGIFFAVELGALASALVLARRFSGEKSPIPHPAARTRVLDPVPSLLLAALILLLALVSFLPQTPACTNGLIACALFLLGLILKALRERSLSALAAPLQAIDHETLALLTGLFLMIGGLQSQGVINALGDSLAAISRGQVFRMYTILVWGSVVISAFIDNIPYVATMIPVVASLSAEMGCEPTLFYFGLLSGATLGGNCTPIGASANIVGISILRRAHYNVSDRDFFEIGIPFTLAALLPAYLFLWFFYGV